MQLKKRDYYQKKNIRKEKMVGYMIRGETRLVEEGEKPTRNLKSLEIVIILIKLSKN